MEEKMLNVSSSPHVRDNSSTKSIMRDVVIALLPATIVGIYNFREWQANLVNINTGIFACHSITELLNYFKN